MASMRRLALTALLLLPGAAFAQEADAPADAAKPAPKPPITDCQSLAANLTGIIALGADGTAEDIENGCRFTNASLPFDTQFIVWKAAEVLVTGPDLIESAAAGTPPKALDVEVRRARQTYSESHGIDPLSGYIMQVGMIPMNMHVAYEWDEASKVFTLENARIFSRDGDLDAFLELAGIDALPTDIDSPAEIPGIAFSQYRIKIDNKGIFEGFIAPALLAMLPYGEDPAESLPPIKTMIKGVIAGLPATTADEETKTLLAQFVDQFPHPTGVYDLSVTAAEPIPLVETFENAEGPDVLIGLLDQLKIEAKHTPGPAYFE